jgi:hypothetical protein
MKRFKYIFFFLILQFILTNKGWTLSITIKLVFESGFSSAFQAGQPWADVDEDDVKELIISRVTADFSPFSISVSTSTGNIIAYIGRSGGDSAMQKQVLVVTLMEALMQKYIVIISLVKMNGRVITRPLEG